MYLDQLIAVLEKHDPQKIVKVGFSNPHSWRGDYYDLAFVPTPNVTIGSMLESAKSANGKTFTGYKGGEFSMNVNTRVHLDFEGSASGPELTDFIMNLMIHNTIVTLDSVEWYQ